jgi:Na+/melibiose symporter-like transporter
MYLAQNLILMGIFFTMPLYLQVVQGYDAFETGLRMLPISVTLFIMSLLGPKLAQLLGPRRVVRIGLAVLVASILFLLGLIEPEIDTASFNIAMAGLGIGMGLLAGQLGNIVQGAVGASERSEAGGLQNTAAQLGSALGTALMGAIVIGGLASTFLAQVDADPALSQATKDATTTQLEAGVPFVTTDQAAAAATDAGLPPAEVTELVDRYSDSQLEALKAGLLVAAGISLVAFVFTRRLPPRVVVPAD